MQNEQAHPARLDGAMAAFRAADYYFDATNGSEAAGRALETAIDKLHEQAEAILARPATTLAALKAKARAFEWKMKGGTIDEVDIDNEPATVAALRSLLADIEAIA